MLAVIATGGKQYLVKTGEIIKVEKLDVLEGGEVIFDQVLLTSQDDGTDAILGAPFIDGVKIKAKVLKQGKERTLLVQKFKRKVRYHKARGQRQRFTQVQIA